MPESNEPWPSAEENDPPSACPTGGVEGVELRDTPVGLGVFVTRGFPVDAVIGEVAGQLIQDADYGSDYAFDLGGSFSLEPDPPFRFLNHSCRPNCEYVYSEEEDGEQDGQQDGAEQGGAEQEEFEEGFDFEEASEGKEAVILPRLYIVALRDVTPGEQLTIDYGWSAESSIPCRCGEPTCRGWIVCEEELPALRASRAEQLAG